MAKGFASGKPIYIASAKGALMYDVEGKEYIDFGGGIAVMNVGHSNPRVVKAIQDQAAKFTHTCFMVAPYDVAVHLGVKLCKIAPGKGPKRAMFANSGAEAVENVVKIARYHTKRQGIVVLDHAFHGRTLLCMTMTSKGKPYKWGFGPFAPEVYRIPNAYCYRCPFGLAYPKCDCACADYLKDFFGKIPADMLAAVVYRARADSSRRPGNISRNWPRSAETTASSSSQTRFSPEWRGPARCSPWNTGGWRLI
jgi:4-aminobutyrate aminotransferase/(S)-3-amino-2-methylpropionate transaminase